MFISFVTECYLLSTPEGNMMNLFSGMMPDSLIATSWHFGGRSSRFLRNGGKFVLYYKV